MLTAILLAFDAPGRPLRRDAVTRSLSSLVEACVQGLVADAVLVGAPQRGLATISDDAGCALLECESAGDGLAQALGLARYEQIFLLQAGFAIERGFIDEMHDALTYGERGRPLTLRAAPNSLMTRLAPQFAPAVGLVAARSALREAGGADLDRLSRKLKSADLLTRARKVI